MKEKLKYLFIICFFILPAIYYGITDNYKVSGLLLFGVLAIYFLEKNPDFVDKYF
jgi:hypothetical protein